MALGASFAAGYSAFGSPDDYRLPLGIWYSAPVGLGDTSGGGVTLNVVIYPGGLVEQGAWHNLTSLSFVVVGTPAAETPQLTTSGWSLRYEGGNFSHQSYALPTNALGATERAMNWESFTPLTLGRRSSVAGATFTGLTIRWATNTNGNIYTVQLAGHYWSPEALQLSGGPQNPGVAMDALPQPPGGRGFYQRLRAGMLE